MIRIRNLKINIEKNQDITLREKISKKLKISLSSIQEYRLVKKSIDARNKKNIFFVYEVDVLVFKESDVLKRHHDSDVFLAPEERYDFVISGSEILNHRIVIIGSGPAGLFCAYLLAEAGYCPLIVERGEKLEDRVQTVQRFFETNQLNMESNIQFGEGGAGTFSDGKLNTLVKDKEHRGRKVFEIFVENGAPEEIFYLAKPHIGTDVLRKVIVSMREKIIRWGGEFCYRSKVTDFVIKHGSVCGIIVNNQRKIDCDCVVLAIGHSARDTFSLLREKGLNMKAKNFAVGIRMIHPQSMINESQYGTLAPLLPPASYKLTYQTSKGRGVYSFCMCPGGYVVNASSEENMLAINGMSNYLRNGENANSAIVVTVGKEDFGDDVFSGMNFQRKLEKKAYLLGDGNIPIQLYKDFVNNQKSQYLGDVFPTVMGVVSFANLKELFPSFITEALEEAIPYFGKKINGFDREDALLLGVESRTSSPVMIVRGEDGLSNILGIYPCGEGAGYAGGITTAAMDGMKIAELLAAKYRPFP